MAQTILDQYRPALLWRWDAGTLAWVVWDGSLTVGTLVIGAVTQSGLWTVQPGNTANTTAWKVDGSAVTQPVSLATAPSTPVTGTFWQATQPVSGTVNPTTSYGKTITYVNVNQSVAGTTVLAAADATKKHKVVGLALTMSLAGTLLLDDAVANLIGPFDIVASGGLVIPASILPMSETGATNRALRVVSTVGAARGVVAILTEA